MKPTYHATWPQIPKTTSDAAGEGKGEMSRGFNGDGRAYGILVGALVDTAPREFVPPPELNAN